MSNPYFCTLACIFHRHQKNLTYCSFSRCKNQSYLLYKDQKALEAKKFKIQCGFGGFFKPPPDGWPLCDSTEPEKCSDYPQNVPEIVEIVKEEPQLPGGKIYYKCKEEGFVTNIGDLAAVRIIWDHYFTYQL